MEPRHPPANDAERLDNLLAALCLPDDDDEDPGDDAIRVEAAAAGLDLAAFAAEIRAKARARAEAERAARRQATRGDRERAAARLSAQGSEPVRPRAEQLAVMRALLDRAGPRGVSVHFHKFEEATDEDLARLIGELRHLLGDQGGGPS